MRANEYLAYLAVYVDRTGTDYLDSSTNSISPEYYWFQ